MDYKLLTRDELIHLLEDVVGNDIVKERIVFIAQFQREWTKETGLKCWDCISIRNKLLGREMV